MTAIAIAQTAGAAVIAALLFGFYRRHQRSYLLHWTLGWSSLALHLTMIETGRWLGASQPESSMLLLVVGIAAGVTGHLYAGWFLFGAYERGRRRPVRLRDERNALIALVLMGIVTSLLFAGSGSRSIERSFSQSGVLHSVAAAIFFYSAWLLWQRRQEGAFGSAILSTAFFLTGFEHLQRVMIDSGAFFLSDPTYRVSLGYIDFLLQGVLGIGMIACLMEDEQEASELATVQIEHLAYHDALTGLPNRPLYMDRLIVALAQASRLGHCLAVLFLDLDRFKDINDSLGHSTGDTLLKAVADRIQRCVREGDTVARFGGDEFTLLIPRIDDIEDTAKVSRKIIDTLKIPFLIQERELFVTTSIGISIFPNDGRDPETLVRNADAAMYRAKESGRDNYQLYAPAMNARALERLALENMLRRALENNELVLFYQPVVELQSKQVLSAEALIRWQHPELGLLSPAHFISVAELSGLIIPIGQWVLNTACRQVRQWQKRLDHPFSVAVNLSARQFQAPNLVDQVRGALSASGIEPSCLELEITESSAMQNAEVTIHTLRELKQLGIRISMDDFGTGYSSLNYLKRFPLDTLKLDQSFVQDVTTDESDAAIVSAVIAMAHSLKLDVVAEGVETEEQLAFLRQQNCDRIQGYLFSAPVSSEHLEQYLSGELQLAARA